MKMTLADMLRLRTELPSVDAGPIDLTEDEQKQSQAPCQCPPNGNVHQYDCPKMKIAFRVLWQRGTEQDKDNFVKTFRAALPYKSEKELRQFKQSCSDIGAKM